VRVVAGEFKGRRLYAPRGSRTRPTADRVREALFSMLGDVSGARVLDLYAGSGALGIEALSRGAESAVFVERDAKALDALRRNLDATGARGAVRREDVARFLSRPEGTFDLVFADPPYDDASAVAHPHLRAFLFRTCPPSSYQRGHGYAFLGLSELLDLVENLFHSRPTRSDVSPEL